LEQDVGSDLRGIHERITLMKGTVENWQQAKRLHDTVRSGLNNLKVFGSLAEDLAALRPRFDRITLPDVEEGTRLLSSANEHKNAVERFLTELDLGKVKKDAGGLKEKGESAARDLKRIHKKIEGWLQRADSALARARDCAEKAKNTLVKVIVVPGAAELSLGESKSFTAMGEYADGSTTPIKPNNWPSSQKEFTAATTGTHTITATYQGLSGSATVTVTSAETAPSDTPAPGPSSEPTPEPPTPPSQEYGGLFISGPARMVLGSGAGFQAADGGGRPYAGVEWASSVEDVVTIDGSGSAVANKVGTATVIAHKDGMTAFFDVEVVECTSDAHCPDEVCKDGRCVPPFDEAYVAHQDTLEGREGAREGEQEQRWWEDQDRPGGTPFDMDGLTTRLDRDKDEEPEDTDDDSDTGGDDTGDEIGADEGTSTTTTRPTSGTSATTARPTSTTSVATTRQTSTTSATTTRRTTTRRTTTVEPTKKSTSVKFSDTSGKCRIQVYFPNGEGKGYRKLKGDALQDLLGDLVQILLPKVPKKQRHGKVKVRVKVSKCGDSWWVCDTRDISPLSDTLPPPLKNEFSAEIGVIYLVGIPEAAPPDKQWVRTRTYFELTGTK